VLHPALGWHARLGLAEHRTGKLLQQWCDERVLTARYCFLGRRCCSFLIVVSGVAQQHSIHLRHVALAHQPADALLRDRLELQRSCLERCAAIIVAAHQRADALHRARAIDAQLNALFAEADADVVLLQPADAEDELVRRQWRDNKRRCEAHRRRRLFARAGEGIERVAQRRLACRLHLAAVREDDAP